MRRGFCTSIIVEMIATILGEDGVVLDIEVVSPRLDSGGCSSKDRNPLQQPAPRPY